MNEINDEGPRYRLATVFFNAINLTKIPIIIPDEIKSRIFDPFFTTKPVGQGTGMGLAICYQVIVKAHGGKLEFKTQQKNGTEFMIEIPC